MILEKYKEKLYSFAERVNRKRVLLLPYAWFTLFLVIPFCILLKVSFSSYTYGVPPYGDVFRLVENQYLEIKLYFSHYVSFFQDALYINIYLSSIRIAFTATMTTLCVAYPFAYAVHSVSKKWRVPLILMVVLPFYTSFLLRIYAWVGVLNGSGVVNTALMKLGIISEPIQFLYTEFAVTLGMVYCYLPFVLVPIYMSLERMDKALLEAAYDLGATPLKAFFSITIPTTIRGILAGFTLMFVPAIGEFIIPEILGGSSTLMIGRVLWNEFFHNHDWPLAAAMAIMMFIFIAIPLTFLQRIETEDVRK